MVYVSSAHLKWKGVFEFSFYQSLFVYFTTSVSVHTVYCPSRVDHPRLRSNIIPITDSIYALQFQFLGSSREVCLCTVQRQSIAHQAVWSCILFRLNDDSAHWRQRQCKRRKPASGTGNLSVILFYMAYRFRDIHCSTRAEPCALNGDGGEDQAFRKLTMHG